MLPEAPCILIGGTSHVGKSTLGATLARILNTEVISTDALARHPGRPWPKTRVHVAEFYAQLSGDSIYSFLLNHHQNMWTHLKGLIETSMNTESALILEGSALRPEYLADFVGTKAECLCLWAPDALITQRIYANSDYARLAPDQRKLVNAFLQRSLKDNVAIRESAQVCNIPYVDVSKVGAMSHVVKKLTGSSAV